MLGEEAKYELQENAECCFKQILEVALHKTAVVRPLTSYHTNPRSKISKTC